MDLQFYVADLPFFSRFAVLNWGAGRQHERGGDSGRKRQIRHKKWQNCYEVQCIVPKKTVNQHYSMTELRQRTKNETVTHHAKYLIFFLPLTSCIYVPCYDLDLFARLKTDVKYHDINAKFPREKSCHHY